MHPLDVFLPLTKPVFRLAAQTYPLVAWFAEDLVWLNLTSERILLEQRLPFFQAAANAPHTGVDYRYPF